MTSTELSAPTGSREDAVTARRSRSVRTIPTWWRDLSFAAAWGVVLAVVALWVAHGGLQDLSTLSGALTSIGRLCGLVASALILIQVFLMARVPWVEQAWGQDELARLHRLVGFTSFDLVLVHIVLVTLGYAAASPLGLWGTILDLVLNYPGLLLAVAGLVCLVMVVVTSVRRARRSLRYESWHLIHLYGYLGAGLALPHQLWSGTDFTSSHWATVFWWCLYAGCAGSAVVFRLALPLWRSLRHPIRVVDVQTARRGSAEVTTVTVAGQGISDLPAQAGQFFQWRFVGGPGWTRGNPYSLSAAPDGETLRFTAARSGESSARLASLRPGTRVLIEGPYGRMHPGVRTRRKVLLLGAGIGITPMRALLEALPQQPGDVVLAHRVSSREQLVLGEELEALARERGARYLMVEGPRVTGRQSWLPQGAAHLSDVEALRQLCPDVADREVYVCGAPEWMDAARRAALDAGVPSSHIHLERFAY